MKAGTSLIIYLAAALVLVVVLIKTPAYTMFTGEIFIALFVVGLILSFGNTIRQTQKLADGKMNESEPATTH